MNRKAYPSDISREQFDRIRPLLEGALPVAEIAETLEFHVIVCDPREEFYYAGLVPCTGLMAIMSDDAALAIETDPRTAIVALTHDPKIDDMALLEASKAPTSMPERLACNDRLGT